MSRMKLERTGSQPLEAWPVRSIQCSLPRSSRPAILSGPGYRAAALLSGLVLSLLASPARAGSITPNWAFGETANISYSGPNEPPVGTNQGASASYTSVDLGGGYFDLPAGLNSNLADPTSSLSTFPNALTPGLTGAGLNLSADGAGVNVAGSLATGAAHLSESSTGSNAGTGETLDSATVQMQDLLTFAVGGTGSDTITVGLSLDGDASAGFAGSSYSQLIEYNFGNPFMYWQAGTSGGGPTGPTTSPTGGWNSFAFTGDSLTGFNFAGTLTVTNGEVVPITLSQQLNCNNDEQCNFANTLQLSLTLPSDVTYTSASGVFLTQSAITATPEPGTMLLLGMGLVALGGASRRRRA